MVRASLVWPRRGMFLLTLSQFAIPDSSEDTFWDNYFAFSKAPCCPILARSLGGNLLRTGKRVDGLHTLWPK